MPRLGKVREDEEAEERPNNTGVAGDRLKSFIERVERMEEEKKCLQDDIKDIMAEAKGTGFDTKTIRTIIRMRKKTVQERQEEQEMIDLYLSAIGMFE